MAQPVVYNWNNDVQGLQDSLQKIAAVVNGQTVLYPILLNNYADFSWNTGSPNLRFSNVQPISVYVDPKDASSVTLRVTGVDGYGKTQIETPVFTANAKTWVSSNSYSSISSIVCTAVVWNTQTPSNFPTTGTIQSISVSNAPLNTCFMRPFLCDIWNKQALYSYAITNVGFDANSSPLTITLTKGGSSSDITTSPVFSITGITTQGQSITETVGGFTSSSLVQKTQNSYISVFSISITTAAVLAVFPGTESTLTGNITIGSSQVNFSNNFNTKVAGSIPLNVILSVTPQYTLDQLPQWQATGLSGQQPVYNPTWTSMIPGNVPNSNPNPFVIPITSACSASFPNYPITGLRFLVNSSNTASFTATILQQGGYY